MFEEFNDVFENDDITSSIRSIEKREAFMDSLSLLYDETFDEFDEFDECAPNFI